MINENLCKIKKWLKFLLNLNIKPKSIFNWYLSLCYCEVGWCRPTFFLTFYIRMKLYINLTYLWFINLVEISVPWTYATTGSRPDPAQHQRSDSVSATWFTSYCYVGLRIWIFAHESPRRSGSHETGENISVVYMS